MKNIKWLFTFFHFILMFIGSESLRAYQKDFKSLGQISSSEETKVTYTIRQETQMGLLNLELHFKKIYLPSIKRIEKILRKDLLKIINYFEYAPSDTVHIIFEEAESANGSAATLPYSRVFLNDFPPIGKENLSINDDWNLVIVLHEMVHIIHLDQARGILGVFETLFGNLGKMGGVAPRWFSEGLAVWAETEFTQVGRNRNELLTRELKTAYLDPDFCPNISCLSDPGMYPFRQFPYWIGGHFLSYLEKKKKGTLRCLVVSNSYSLPFFLNSAFEECVGINALHSFQKYRNFMMENIISENEKPPKNKMMRTFLSFPLSKDWKTSWQSDFQLMGSRLYLKEYQRFSERLRVYDLDTTKIPQKKKIHEINLSDIISNIFPPSQYDRKLGQIPLGFRSTLIKEGRRTHRYLSIKDEKTSDVLYEDINDGVEYNTRLSQDQNWAFKYFAGKWHLYDVSNINFNLKGVDEKIVATQIWESKVGDSLSQPYWVFDKKTKKSGLIFKYTQGINLIAQKYSLVYIPYEKDIKKIKPYVIFSDSVPFKYYGTCGLNHLIEEKFGTHSFETKDKKSLKNFSFITTQNKGQKSLKYGVTSLFPRNILEIRWNQNWTVFLDQNHLDKFYFKNKGCEYFINKWKGKPIEKFSSVNIVNIAKQNLEDKKFQEDLTSKLESYPSLRHFRPHYWGLFYYSDSYSSHVDFFTSLSDPFGDHQVSLKVVYSTSKSEGLDNRSLSSLLPNISYQYHNEDHFFTVGYLERSSYNRVASSYDKTSNFYFGHSGLYRFNKYFVKESLSVSSLKITSDIAATSDLTRGGLSLNWGRMEDRSDAFFKSFLFANTFYYYQTESLKNLDHFLGIRTHLDFDFNLTERLKLKLNSEYSLLDKTQKLGSSFSGGGGGGVSNPSPFDHAFYGSYRGSLVGNKVTTSRFEFDYSVMDTFKGFGLFPLFIKQTHFLLGIDYAWADEMLLNNTLFSNFSTGAYSVYSGLRSDLTLFYGIPFGVSLVYSLVTTPTSKQYSNFDIFFEGGFVF